MHHKLFVLLAFTLATVALGFLSQQNWFVPPILAAESNTLEKEFVNPVGSSFTNVVTVSNGGVKTLYISGQVGFAGNQIPDDFSQQVENAFVNLRQQLEDAGAELSDIVKTNVYIVDLDREKVAAFSAVRARHFPQQDQPASTMVGVTALVFPGLAVEIEAVAVVED
ncbi:MAG: RidA family protein [Gammaproteobacteria bacterium]|jgi:enamine deaminase RidA (YjgF/YER057c/UK114 family)|nr:RidA family protein [Gammaproteobacteria bacterium]MDP6537105.1 RidA family protein [Gammaproteobacteria bacterium]MDP6733548.1 RidA family protein [Gammaproteobacteria bacterium]HAJ77189.1 RidA family protein [Gammaproteobacteria bacterium]|tara:strand:- start:4420 stop:4920 length:501 start_codon:yes stop_codon:yes gene_type:complete